MGLFAGGTNFISALQYIDMAEWFGAVVTALMCAVGLFVGASFLSVAEWREEDRRGA